MVKCKICNKEFKQITYEHLKKHNLTPYEYKLKFPDDRGTYKKDNPKGKYDLVLNAWLYPKNPNGPKVKCKICGKEYGQISHDHLKRQHGITIDEYKKMFNTLEIRPSIKGVYNEVHGWSYAKKQYREKVMCMICNEKFLEYQFLI